MPSKREEYRDYINSAFEEACHLLSSYPEQKQQERQNAGMLTYLYMLSRRDWTSTVNAVLDTFKKTVETHQSNRALSLNALINCLDTIIQQGYFIVGAKYYFNLEGNSKIRDDLKALKLQWQNKVSEFQDAGINTALSFEQHPLLESEYPPANAQHIRNAAQQTAPNDPILRDALIGIVTPSAPDMTIAPTTPLQPTTTHKPTETSNWDRFTNWIKEVTEDDSAKTETIYIDDITGIYWSGESIMTETSQAHSDNRHKPH